MSVKRTMPKLMFCEIYSNLIWAIRSLLTFVYEIFKIATSKQSVLNSTKNTHKLEKQNKNEHITLIFQKLIILPIYLNINITKLHNFKSSTYLECRSSSLIFMILLSLFFKSVSLHRTLYNHSCFINKILHKSY